MNLDWHADAACRNHPDPDVFWPRSVTEASKIAEARRTCAECPVIRDCYQASRSERWGIWAGLTEWQRAGTGSGTRILTKPADKAARKPSTVPRVHRPANRITPDMIARIIELAGKGHGTHDIGKMVGCSQTGVYRVLKRAAS